MGKGSSCVSLLPEQYAKVKRKDDREGLKSMGRGTPAPSLFWLILTSPRSSYFLSQREKIARELVAS